MTWDVRVRVRVFRWSLMCWVIVTGLVIARCSIVADSLLAGVPTGTCVMAVLTVAASGALVAIAAVERMSGRALQHLRSRRG